MKNLFTHVKKGLSSEKTIEQYLLLTFEILPFLRLNSKKAITSCFKHNLLRQREQALPKSLNL